MRRLEAAFLQRSAVAALSEQQVGHKRQSLQPDLSVETVVIQQQGCTREMPTEKAVPSHTHYCFCLLQPYSRPTVPGCFLTDGKAQSFQHPVRLFWPKSKSFDYLYSDGETLLRNFPVQATISFYDESDSEEDDDDDEEEEEEEDWEEDDDSEE
ncbi:hypothetical protein INR49_016108, partial [Caranx melampygus]